MINFDNSKILKLTPISQEAGYEAVCEMLIEGEDVLYAFKTVRDKVVMTNKRLIAVNVIGITGKKVDYTSLPFKNVQAFSVETTGVFDLDCDLILWFMELGKVHFEISAGFDIKSFNRVLSYYILK